MTTPPRDPDADLDSDDGVPVSELVGRLDNRLRQLVQRVDTHEDQILDTLESLAAELDALRDDIDGSATARPTVTRKRPGDAAAPDSAADGGGDEPPTPRRWAARATPEDWDTLVDWVDQLRTGYSLTGDYVVQPCWPGHPGVVEELAALHQAWIEAALTDEQSSSAGSSGLVAWHDRWLWPTLQRLRSTGYRITNCRQQHLPEDTILAKASSRTLIPRATTPPALMHARSISPHLPGVS